MTRKEIVLTVNLNIMNDELECEVPPLCAYFLDRDGSRQKLTHFLRWLADCCENEDEPFWPISGKEESDAVLYQGGDYIKGSTKKLYFPEVHGEAERGTSPWEGWEPGKYISVYNNNEENVKIARLQIIRWESLNKICATKVVEVYRY